MIDHPLQGSDPVPRPSSRSPLVRIVMIERDPRMQLGAYITDGIDLYEVAGMQRGPGLMGM